MLRENQLIALGHKCIILNCNESRSEYLEVHHLTPVLSRSRSRSKSYFSTDPKKVEIRCLVHHAQTDSFRGRASRYYLIEELIEEKEIN
jgi:hypothetical protein